MSNPLPSGLSVILIGRNSTRYLTHCLRSLGAIATERIFVDTGSTDATPDLARSLDCRIFQFEWRDDFSAARNFAISRARYSWILSVDTDEILTTHDGEAIIERVLVQTSAPAYAIYQDNVYDSGEIKPNPVARLFRNDPRIRFRNPVHECISESLLEGWPGFRLPTLELRLRHYGYLSFNIAGKHDRNLAILRRWVTNSPDHLFANFKLGSTLFDLGALEECLPYLNKAATLFDDPRTRGIAPYLHTFIVIYHRALVAAKRMDEARRFASVASEWVAAEAHRSAA